MPVEIIIAGVVSVVSSGGAAWAGVRASLNGTRERVTRMELRQDNMDEKLDRIAESTARLEVYNSFQNMDNG